VYLSLTNLEQKMQRARGSRVSSRFVHESLQISYVP
jgi:hypothetical protein